MQIEIEIEDARWNALNLAGLAETAAIAVLLDQALETEAVTLSVLGCDDSRIAELNDKHRGKPCATNVLSWPAEDRGAEDAGGVPLSLVPDIFGETALGDLAIAYETCLRESEEQGKPPRNHVSHLLVHGILHLMGYDHTRDEDALLMEQIEIRILERMGIVNPYEV